MIQVPPGEYRITSWVRYGWLTKKRMSSKEFPLDRALARRFTVQAGQVTFLGAFRAETTRTFAGIGPLFGLIWKIEEKIELRGTCEGEVVAALRQGYPGFAETPVRCLRAPRTRHRHRTRRRIRSSRRRRARTGSSPGCSCSGTLAPGARVERGAVRAGR